MGWWDGGTVERVYEGVGRWRGCRCMKGNRGYIRVYEGIEGI